MNLQTLVSRSGGGLSEQQLEVWSRQGAQATASATYKSIQSALARTRFREGAVPEVYLQGSYRNSTNIYGNSDVDIVVQLNSVYIANTDGLSSVEKALYERNRIPATYTFDAFHSDVIKGLQDYYGTGNVIPKSKCIQVGRDASGNRLTADVVPCLLYRKYFQYTDGSSRDCVEGMTFRTASAPRRWIVNYPKLHYARGAAKNADAETAGRYKPTVRIFKNARDRYNDTHATKVEAPYYFVAGLLSNVPSRYFVASRRETYLAVISWLESALGDNETAQMLLCQNGVVPIFGPGPDQWEVKPAKRFVSAMSELWEGR